MSTAHTDLLIDASRFVRGASAISVSVAEAAKAFETFGEACRRLQRDSAFQRMLVATLRDRLGWRRFFSDAWYQAVYDLHQATRYER